MRINKEIDGELAKRLAVLEDQPARDPEKTARGRKSFLALAQNLANSQPAPISVAQKWRHIWWMHPIQTIFQVHKKEQSTMLSTLGTILVILTLLVGGGGVTVAAAQSSLPDETLYPVKEWSEAVRTGFASDDQTRMELAMVYANRRAEEMKAMLQEGKTPPVTLQTRMQAEVDLALQLAAGQADEAAVQSFEMIRARLQEQEQMLQQQEGVAGANSQAIIKRTRTMLQERLYTCEEGLQDPATVRERLQNRNHERDGAATSTLAARPTQTSNGNPDPTGTPAPGGGNGAGPRNEENGAGGGSGSPRMTGTPTPGSSYGPGPGDGSSDGNSGTMGGGNPWVDDTPTPGSSYGPGPGDGSGDGAMNGGSDGGNSPEPQDPTSSGSGNGPGPGDGDGNGGGGTSGGSGAGDGGSGSDGAGSGNGGGGGGGSGNGRP